VGKGKKGVVGGGRRGARILSPSRGGERGGKEVGCTNRCGEIKERKAGKGTKKKTGPRKYGTSLLTKRRKKKGGWRECHFSLVQCGA